MPHFSDVGNVEFIANVGWPKNNGILDPSTVHFNVECWGSIPFDVVTQDRCIENTAIIPGRLTEFTYEAAYKALLGDFIDYFKAHAVEMPLGWKDKLAEVCGIAAQRFVKVQDTLN